MHSCMQVCVRCTLRGLGSRCMCGPLYVLAASTLAVGSRDQSNVLWMEWCACGVRAAPCTSVGMRRVGHLSSLSCTCAGARTRAPPRAARADAKMHGASRRPAVGATRHVFVSQRQCYVTASSKAPARGPPGQARVQHRMRQLGSGEWRSRSDLGTWVMEDARQVDTRHDTVTDTPRPRLSSQLMRHSVQMQPAPTQNSYTLLHLAHSTPDDPTAC